MKLSDYVACFLADRQIRHVFAVTGGAAAHLIDSVAKNSSLEYICPQHEQAGAMAADGYARASGGLGCAIATSGPGATNLITGICSAYYDSVPVIFITGQVSTFRMKKDTGVRQLGFQETDILSMCKPVTKYAVQINDPKSIRYELEKLCHIATSGRPGPVLIDIPDNLQREEIDPRNLTPFIPESEPSSEGDEKLDVQIEQCLELLKKAKRPVVVLGWGVRLAKAEDELRKFLMHVQAPFVPTWAVADILPSDHPLYIGTFGTHGTRHANFAVQNADLILAIGSRLDTKATGSPPSSFARGAKKIIVDIDPTEMRKFEKSGLLIDLRIKDDAKHFLTQLNRNAAKEKKLSYGEWLGWIRVCKNKHPVCPSHYYAEKEVNPYVLITSLSQIAEEGDVIVVDTGCTVAWTMQTFEFKSGQRLFHDWNNTAMGWALPASIGVSLALGRKKVICITGDGSLQMNIQELATVVKHQLPIKIIVINNNGYGMIQQTQDQWLDSRYEASSIASGLAFPNFVKVAQAYGFDTFSIAKNDGITNILKEAFATKGPAFCNVELGLGHRVTPQVKFGLPNEDMEPLLSRKEFLENMIIEPLKQS